MVTASAHKNIIPDTASGVDFEIDLLTFELADRFTARQLRREIHTAEKHAFLSEFFEGTPYKNWLCDAGWWRFYRECCEQAIKSLKQAPKQSTPTPGRIDVEAIKSRSDIVSVIANYTALRKSGKRFTGKCPIHGEKTASLFVYPDNQSWHCFGACNTGGDAIDFIMRAENCNFKQAAAILGGLNAS